VPSLFAICGRIQYTNIFCELSDVVINNYEKLTKFKKVKPKLINYILYLKLQYKKSLVGDGTSMYVSKGRGNGYRQSGYVVDCILSINL
jgi:hypothetical protein